MTERIPAPTEIADTNWNSDGSTYPSTDPGGPKRDTGFKPDNVPPASGDGEIITANDQNWLHGLTMQMLTWFKQFVPREWEDVAEGLAEATTVRDLFRVVPPLAAMRARLASAYTVAGSAATGGFPTFICTDGEQIYYIAGAGNVSLIAADPTDGSEIWESGAVTQFLAICADGLFVYASGAVADVGLRKINRTTGAAAGNVNGDGHSYRLVRANGFFAAMIAPTGLLGTLNLFTVATPTYEANDSPTTNLNALGMDADQCYVGGTRNTGNDVWAYQMTVGALVPVWSVALDANDPSPINSIVADGDHVYVVTDAFAVAAGGNKNLFCLSRYDGELLWSLNVKGAAVDLDVVGVDDRYLYVIDEFHTLIQICLRSPTAAPIKEATDCADAIACDGVSVFCSDNATAANFRRVWAGGPTKTFMRSAPADPTRRPWPNLAIPADS